MLPNAINNAYHYTLSEQNKRVWFTLLTTIAVKMFKNLKTIHDKTHNLSCKPRFLIWSLIPINFEDDGFSMERYCKGFLTQSKNTPKQLYPSI